MLVSVTKENKSWMEIRKKKKQM